MYTEQTSLIFAAENQPSYPAVSPVNPYLQQVKDKETKMRDGCGMSFTALSQSVSRLGLLQKMYLDLLPSLNIPESSKTWKQKVTQSKHLYYRLLTTAHRISDEERLLLPTPAASQLHKVIRKRTPSEMKGKHGKMLVGELGTKYPCLIGKYIHPKFVEWMMGFPEEWTNPDCKLSAMQLCRASFTRSSKQLEQSKKET